MADSTGGSTTGTEHLGPSECWWLLSRAEVGRLGVVTTGSVEIFPVNFVVRDRRIVFRTSPGEKLLALTQRSGVAFEIDGWDEESAWSVLVKGTAQQLDVDARLATDAEVEPWVPDPKHTYVAIEPGEVTGRRFRRGPKRETLWYW